MERHMDMSQEPFCVDMYTKNAEPKARKRQFVRKMTGKMPDPKRARGILCRNLQEKCRTQIPRPAFYASLRSRNAHGHITKAGNLEEKCRTRIPRTGVNTSIEHWAFNPYRKNPFSVATLFGEYIHVTIPLPSGCLRSSFSCSIHKFLSCVATGIQ